MIASIAVALVAGAGVGIATSGPDKAPSPERPDVVAPATGGASHDTGKGRDDRAKRKKTGKDRAGREDAGTEGAQGTTPPPADDEPGTPASTPTSAPPAAPAPSKTPGPSSPSATPEPSPTDKPTKEPDPSPSEPDELLDGIELPTGLPLP